MRINIFTAIPLGVYLYKVETTKKGGWEETDKFLQGLGKEIHDNEVKFGTKGYQSKKGSTEKATNLFTLVCNRGADVALDLVFLTIDSCYAGMRTWIA